MSTFLELVQDLHRNAGMSGSAPTSVATQTGEAQRAVRWVRDADQEVQKKWHDWKFLWSPTQYSASTVAGTQDATVPTTQGIWDRRTFRLDGELISVVEYETVKHEIFSTATADRGQPSRIIILPNKNLRFDPVPDAAYVIKSDYFLKPVILSSNAQVSKIPEEYHQVIVGKALMYYGAYENAPDAIALGSSIFDMWLDQLESECLPNEFSSRRTSSGNQIEVIAS